MLGQHAAGEEWNDSQRNHQRRRHREQHGCRQRADEGTRAFRQEQQGREGEHQGCRAAYDGHANLLGAGDGGIKAAHALAQAAGDVFGDHNRVVYQQAQRENKASDGELVQRKAGRLQQGDANGERERDRDHDDQGGPQAEGQQRHQHERERDAKVPEKTGEAVIHILRLVEAPLDGDALRHFPLELLDRRVDRVAHAEDVFAILHVRCDEQGRFAVPAGLVALFVIGPGHLRDIRHADGARLR